jgi:hypothetical protein
MLTLGGCASSIAIADSVAVTRGGDAMIGRPWQRLSSCATRLSCAAVMTACATGGHPGTDDGGGSGTGSGTGTGSGSGVDSRMGGTPDGPPTMCNAGGADAPATALTFTDNLIASPAPPGSLTPQNAPQIVVFGWDDIENLTGVQFVNSLLAGVNNPNGKKASANMNPNACYAEGWPQPAGKYSCGDGTLATNRASVTSAGFTVGNHTIDHLEPTSTWSGIPAQYKSADGGWVTSPDGYGPGVLLDQATWQKVINANDAELKSVYGVTSIKGFRAPRLEINDNGLKALKAAGYTYDQSLEELQPDGYVDALVGLDTAGKHGFNWVTWPYTLDNGSPGIWIQQSGGDKAFIKDYPKGLWEVPTYEVYIPNTSGMGTTIANRMMAADKACAFPPDVPDHSHCFLSNGELNPGDALREVTAFDFNTYVYARMTAAEWTTAMKHSFLARYYGNRAPLGYGGHPIEYTDPYDSYTLAVQPNNYGYRDVLDWNTYTSRQSATKAFVQWIKNDPALSKDTYFMSAQQLVDFMKSPFDKTGAAVGADPVASPDSNALFSRVGWTGVRATLSAVDGNTADITFAVSSIDDLSQVVAGISAGALEHASHIDIKYKTDVPVRMRLLTNDGSVSMTVLLAGVGGDRTARIRVKDFFPGPEATAAQVASAALVDAAYLKKVSAIAFEAAPTPVTGAGTFHTHIDQITIHGVDSAALCSP